MFWPNQAGSAADALPPAMQVFLLLLAPALGSFLGVLVDRLPRGKDVLFAPSRCRSCGTRLRFWELLPILSFVWARGRCRHCGAAIPPWCLYLEILALGVAVLTLAAGGDGTFVVLSCLFLWGVLALAVLVLIWAALGGRQDLAWALLGAGIGMGSFLALRLGYRQLRGREGLGLGDVKLMAALGGFAGPFELPLLVLMAALLALAGGLVRFLARFLACGLIARLAGRDAKMIPPPVPSVPLGQQVLPFGAALCAAAALLWLWRVLGGGMV